MKDESGVAIPATPQGHKAVPLKKLAKLAGLIDPPPVEVDGKVMVFQNPRAAEVLRRLSAEVRELLEYRAPDGVEAVPAGPIPLPGGGNIIGDAPPLPPQPYLPYASSIAFPARESADGVKTIYPPFTREQIEEAGRRAEELSATLRELGDGVAYSGRSELLEALKMFLVEKPIDEVIEYGELCKARARSLIQKYALLEFNPTDEAGDVPVDRTVFVFHPDDPTLRDLPDGTLILLQRKIPSTPGVSACPHGVPHRWPCDQCDAAAGVSVSDGKTK